MVSGFSLYQIQHVCTYDKHRKRIDGIDLKSIVVINPAGSECKDAECAPFSGSNWLPFSIEFLNEASNLLKDPSASVFILAMSVW